MLICLSRYYAVIFARTYNFRGIKVGFAGSVLSEATAETALALLLTTSRRIPEAIEAAKTGAWGQWTPYWMCGKALQGSTVGILGLGKIGQSIAMKIAAFEPSKIIYHNRNKRNDVPEAYEYVNFDRLLEDSDFLIISLSAGPESVNILDKSSFEKMKNDSILINVSR